MTATTLSLRPLGTGELLDRAVRLYRRHFLTFIGIIAIVQVPLVLLQTGFSLLTIQGVTGASDFSDTTFLAGSIGSMVLAILSLLLVSSLGTAALTRAIANSYLGQPVTLAGAYRQIGKSWLVLVLALLLIFLLGILLSLWWLIPCIGWFTGLGMLLYLSLVISPLTAPTVVLEKQRARAAVRRAWDLSRRRFWPVVGFVSVLFIFNLIFTTVPALLVSFLLEFGMDSAMGSFAQQQMVSTLVSSLTTLVFSLIFLPFQLTAMTLLYFDLRIRTEGFDLALLARSVDLPVPQEEGLAGELAVRMEPAAAADLTESIAEAPAPEREPLVTGRELGYFLAITLTLGVLYSVLVFGIGLLAAVATGGM
jgi:hypothetical protein